MTLRRIGFVLVVAGLAAPAVFAGPKNARGNVTAVDWNRNQIQIKDPQGNVNMFRIDPNASVRFDDGAEAYPNPTVRDIVAPMYLHFVYEDFNGEQTPLIQSVQVREIPANLRTPGARANQGSGAAGGSGGTRTVKARITSLDERRGEFRADVAGRSESFRAERPRQLERFREGDLVVITANGDLVTSIQSAASSGRVIRVDERRGEIALEVDGRQETYRVSDKKLLDRVRTGDSIRFEFEDRPGSRNVITAIY
jgi:hypothetical protein